LKFSVLTSIYRNESPKHLDLALESIWDKQSLKPSQIVVVKDGSLTPELEAILTKWQVKLGSVYHLVEFTENKGLGAALKVGLECCKYDLVARMDTDDIATFDRFRKQSGYLRDNPDVDILGSFVYEMSYFGKVGEVRQTPEVHEEIVPCLWASPMIHPTIMMRRNRILIAGNYDWNYRRRQDYELWFRCAGKGLRFHNLPEPLLFYRFGIHTHKKQTTKLAWKQAMIGYKGAKKINLPVRYRFFCFLPFLRSLFPTKVQHYLYKIFKPFDPRRRS
jgi:glycosyltransferase involved in cell wall biosynthesis